MLYVSPLRGFLWMSPFLTVRTPVSSWSRGMFPAAFGLGMFRNFWESRLYAGSGKWHTHVFYLPIFWQYFFSKVILCTRGLIIGLKIRGKKYEIHNIIPFYISWYACVTYDLYCAYGAVLYIFISDIEQMITAWLGYAHLSYQRARLDCPHTSRSHTSHITHIKTNNQQKRHQVPPKRIPPKRIAWYKKRNENKTWAGHKLDEWCKQWCFITRASRVTTFVYLAIGKCQKQISLPIWLPTLNLNVECNK